MNLCDKCNLEIIVTQKIKQPEEIRANKALRTLHTMSNINSIQTQQYKLASKIISEMCHV